MSTVDFRTRFDGDAVDLDPATFLDEIAPALVDAYGGEAGRYTSRLELVPLTLDVDGESLTFSVDDRQRLEVQSGGGGEALVVALDRHAFSDLVQDVASAFGLYKTGRAHVQKGTLDAFVEWEPVLRCLLDGLPEYVPGSIEFHDRNGAPLDPRQSFTLDDTPADIGHFLAEAGFLHLAGVFTEDEMAAVSAELDAAVEAAERNDGASWWARTSADEWYAARILGFNQRSAALRHLLHTDRFRSIGSFTDDSFLQRDPDVGDSAEGLLKKVGVVEGISDVSWHKDCSLGGHSRGCCGLVVGISVTGADRQSGELGVVPGSHRANIPHLGIEGLDLPRLGLPTRTGDVTVHCSCTLHMSRPPVSAERRVVYTGFKLGPRPGDRRFEIDHDEVRQKRLALSEHTVREQQRGQGSARIASHELT